MAASESDAQGDVTGLLNTFKNGEHSAGDALMAAVYAELRHIAAAKMARENQAQTLQATALVHEAWLRLGNGVFHNRAHYFAAAAEAMRRILVERARRKKSLKHGARAEHLDVAE